MNPIERAVARSEKAAAANNALEGLSRRQKIADGPRSTIAGLPHGETAHFGSPGATGRVSVTYHERQSYGDNNQPVRGATTGEYTVTYPNGKSDTFSHGPHANTAAAAKRGANPNARGSAASAAHDAVVRHLAKSQVFNHQGPAPAGAGHVARPSDEPGSGNQCKDCGERISWLGPNHSDWTHVRP